jgi:hypothetical protein
MVSHGQFEGMVPYITVTPQTRRVNREVVPINPAYKFGVKPIQIPVDQTDPMQAHIGDFLNSMRTRQKPHLDVETGAKAVVVINLASQSYREGKVVYWDEKHWKASDKPVKA